MTATYIRKWIVTVCHQKKTEGVQVDESALRLAMCHSDRTAQTFYLREDMTEVAARATLTISQCTREAPIPSQRPSNTSSATTAQPQVDLQPVPQSDDSAPFSSAQPVTQPDVTAVQVTSESEPTRPDVTAVQVTSVSEPKRSLTQGEKAEISKIFVEEISSNKKITLKGIRAGLQESVLLRGLLLIASMDRKIADRVYHCRATAPRSLPEDTQTTDDRIQQWQEKDSTASLNTNLSSRRGWSADDNQILERRFANVTKCPKKKELELILSESEELKDLLFRNEFKRVHQKVKNLLKKKK